MLATATLSRRARPRFGAWVAVSLSSLALAACQSGQAEDQVIDPLTGPVDTATSYSFLSMPDFLNADIADASLAAGYQPGAPNSITPSLRAGLDLVMGQVASEGVPDIYVAGDLVEGHWGKDSESTGTFGAVDTRVQKRKAVERAGDLYFQHWLRLFADRGLRAFPAVGDHDMGDNEWGLNHGIYPRFKQRNFDVFRSTYVRNVMTNPDGSAKYADHPEGPAAGTAYAVRPNPEVQLVSLDVFEHRPKEVVAQLDPEQLAWLDGVLSKAVADGVDWIIVQGHTPVVTPVRMKGSSGLMYDGGVDSPFWQTMAKYGVDLYLCGEVHAVSMHHVDGITQIAHGGLFAYGFSNYIRADIEGGTMTIEAKAFKGKADRSDRVWQTDAARGMPSRVTYQPEPVVRGTLTVTSDNRVTESSGLLREYLP
jgi:hypothetical protein